MDSETLRRPRSVCLDPHINDHLAPAMPFSLSFLAVLKKDEDSFVRLFDCSIGTAPLKVNDSEWESRH